MIVILHTNGNAVFREKLTVRKTAKKLSEIHGTRMFIAVFKTARHLSLSCARL